MSPFIWGTTVVHNTANKGPLFKEPEWVAARLGSLWSCGWSHSWRAPRCRQLDLPREVTCTNYSFLGQVVNTMQKHCGFGLSIFPTWVNFFFVISYFGILCALRFLPHRPSGFRSPEKNLCCFQLRTQEGTGAIWVGEECVWFVYFLSQLLLGQGKRQTQEVCANQTTLLSLLCVTG